MAIMWNLRRWLAVERNIYRPTQLRSLLAEQAGYHLTIQAVANLMNGPPSELRLRTIDALCRSLDCKLSDFCEVSPELEPSVAVTTVHPKLSRQDKRKRVSEQRRAQIVFPGSPTPKPSGHIDRQT